MTKVVFFIVYIGLHCNFAEEIADKKDLPTTCSEEYRAIEGHTMCLLPSPHLVYSGLSRKDKLELLRRHNDYRRSVNPPATDMPAMRWDDKLASVAQQWANQCIFGHDQVNQVAGYDEFVGQEIKSDFSTWEEALEDWHGQVAIYQYGVKTEVYLGVDGWPRVAHYTQLVHNTTILVGCGYSECQSPDSHNYLVCNYHSGQGGRLEFPYTAGERCAACPRSCSRGLCDCGGKFCFHGGTLDPDLCVCKCLPGSTNEDCSGRPAEEDL